jgi:hypothetical protein
LMLDVARAFVGARQCMGSHSESHSESKITTITTITTITIITIITTVSSH